MRTKFTSAKEPIITNDKRQLDLLNDVQIGNLAGSWEWEPKDDYYFWTDSMFYLHGLCPTSNNIISIEAAHQLIHPADLEYVQQQLTGLQKTGHADYYFRIVTTEHKVKRLHARAKGVLTEEGGYFFRGGYQDESKEKEFQQVLEEEIDRQQVQITILERAEEIAQMGNWQINLSTHETFYSDNIYRLHGILPDSLKAHTDTFVQFIHPADRDVVLNAFEKSYQEKIPLHLEYRIIRPDNEERYLKQISSIVKNTKGEQILTGTTHDITERKLLELQLRDAHESMQLQHQINQQAEKIGHTGTWQINLATRKINYSDNVFRIYGLKPQSLPAGLSTFLPYIHPEDEQLTSEALKKIIEEHVPPPAFQFKIIRNDGKARNILQKTKLVKNAAGENIMMAIIHDVTEQHEMATRLRKTNEKLLIQNELFSQAEKTAAIGNWFWNVSTGEVYYSDNAYNIHGVKPQSLTPHIDSFVKYIHVNDRQRVKDTLHKMKDEEQPVELEYKIIRADADLRYLRNRNKRITSPEGDLIVIGTIQDITNEVLLQQQLTERNDFSEMLSDTILDRIMVTDTANNIIGWNKQCEKIYSLKRDELLGKNIFDVLPQLKNAETLENFQQALQGKTIQLQAVKSVITKKYQDILMRPVKNKKEEIVGVLIVLRDVTQQYLLKQQLQERLTFIERLVESGVDRIMVLDRNLNYVLWNKNCEKHYDIKKEEILGKNVLELFPMFKTEPIYQDCKKALKGETVYLSGKENHENEYSETYLIPLKNEQGEVTGILWVIHDLTEIMRAKEKLQINETHLKLAQEVAHLGSWEYDRAVGTLIWSDEVFRMYGYEPGSFEPTIDFYLDTSHHDDRADLEKLINITAEAHSFINRIYSVDGRIRYIHTLARSITDSSGEVIKVIGTVQDVTEQKLLQDELYEKNLAIRTQYEGWRQADLVRNVSKWIWNLDNGNVTWGENLYRMLGYSPHAFRPSFEKFLEFVHPDDRGIITDVTERPEQLSNGIESLYEYRVLDKDGEVKYFRSGCRIINTKTGRMMSGTVQDVTREVMLKQKIKRYEEMFGILSGEEVNS